MANKTLGIMARVSNGVICRKAEAYDEGFDQGCDRSVIFGRFVSFLVMEALPKMKYHRDQ